MPVRKFLLATAALLSSVLHGQQLYLGAIGGTALTRDFPLFESIYPGDSFGNPADVFRHFSGPRSLILGGLVGVRLAGSFSLEANFLRRPWRTDMTLTTYPPGSPSITTRQSYLAANAWEFPLMLKCDLPVLRDRRMRPFAEGGVAFRSMQNVSGVQLSVVGATFGGGVAFHIGSIRIAPTLRYTRWQKETHFPPYPSRADQIEFLTSIAWRSEDACWRIAGHRMDLGLLGGLGLTPEFQSPWEPIHEKTRYVAGVSVELDLGHRLSLEIDGMYKPLRAGTNSTDRFSVLTWQFPVLAKRRWTRQRYTPFVEAGPSFRISGNLNGYNPSHYGATAGAGIEVRVGAVRMSPALRYTRWARDSYRYYVPPGASYTYDGTRPNALELLFGLTF
jgi:hypothetical protein